MSCYGRATARVGELNLRQSNLPFGGVGHGGRAEYAVFLEEFVLSPLHMRRTDGLTDSPLKASEKWKWRASGRIAVFGALARRSFAVGVKQRATPPHLT